MEKINSDTQMPFTIKRHLWSCDEKGKMILLESVSITIERACWEREEVESFGFEGDWHLSLRDDQRFSGLSECAMETACDSAFYCLEDLARRLSIGESIPVLADDEKEWFPKDSLNI